MSKYDLDEPEDGGMGLLSDLLAVAPGIPLDTQTWFLGLSENGKVHATQLVVEAASRNLKSGQVAGVLMSVEAARAEADADRLYVTARLLDEEADDLEAIANLWPTHPEYIAVHVASVLWRREGVAPAEADVIEWMVEHLDIEEHHAQHLLLEGRRIGVMFNRQGFFAGKELDDSDHAAEPVGLEVLLSGEGS